MPVLLRLGLAIAAIVVGNRILPADMAVETVSADLANLKLFGGTVLVVLGAIVVARTVVTAARARFFY